MWNKKPDLYILARSAHRSPHSLAGKLSHLSATVVFKRLCGGQLRESYSLLVKRVDSTSGLDERPNVPTYPNFRFNISKPVSSLVRKKRNLLQIMFKKKVGEIIILIRRWYNFPSQKPCSVCGHYGTVSRPWMSTFFSETSISRRPHFSSVFSSVSLVWRLVRSQVCSAWHFGLFHYFSEAPCHLDVATCKPPRLTQRPFSFPVSCLWAAAQTFGLPSLGFSHLNAAKVVLKPLSESVLKFFHKQDSPSWEETSVSPATCHPLGQISHKQVHLVLARGRGWYA